MRRAKHEEGRSGAYKRGMRDEGEKRHANKRYALVNGRLERESSEMRSRCQQKAEFWENVKEMKERCKLKGDYSAASSSGTTAWMSSGSGVSSAVN